jgi:AcrR family transcriptional regulator
MFSVASASTRRDVPIPLPPRPQQARSEKKRRRLYEAAVKEFAEHGFDQSRVEDIVADAGVSWGTFFRYFPRKEDVLLQMGVEHYRTVMDSFAPQPTVRATVRALLAAILTSDWPSHLHGAILREVYSTPMRYSALLAPDNVPWIGLVADLMAQGQEQGEVRADVSTATLAAVVVAASLFPAILGGYDALPSLRTLPNAGDPIAILDEAFPVAWRGVEAILAAPD